MALTLRKCENFSLKGQVSYEHLKRGNSELIFQLAIILQTIEEEKTLLWDGAMYKKQNKAGVHLCLQ